MKHTFTASELVDLIQSGKRYTLIENNEHTLIKRDGTYYDIISSRIPSGTQIVVFDAPVNKKRVLAHLASGERINGEVVSRVEIYQNKTMYLVSVVGHVICTVQFGEFVEVDA